MRARNKDTAIISLRYAKVILQFKNAFTGRYGEKARRTANAYLSAWAESEGLKQKGVTVGTGFLKPWAN